MNTSLGRFQRLRDRPGDTAPAFSFDLQLLLAGLGQAVVFCAAVVFGVSPKRGNPAFVFHAVQGGEKRAGLDEKGASGELLDAAGDAQPVEFAGDQRLEDEQVESALQKGGGFGVQNGLSYRSSIGMIGVSRIECQ